MGKPILGYTALHGALIARLQEGDAAFKDRSKYIGASEVGGCPRLTAFRKALGKPWVPDSGAAGVMLPGQLTESEGVALLRKLGLNEGALSKTGKDQIEVASGSLHAHPDGIFEGQVFELDDKSIYFKANGEPWDHQELKEFLNGFGVLEFKSGSSTVFNKAIKQGLSQQYQDQVQSSMGILEFEWAMLIFVCRDNYSKVAIFFLKRNEGRFRELIRLADAILESASLARNALLEVDLPECEFDPHDSGVQLLTAEYLLDGDPERGYCQTCPLLSCCPSMVKPLALNSFPSEIMEEATLLAQIIVEQGEIAKIAEEQKENARDRLIDLGKQYCASYLASPFGSGYKSFSIQYQKGKEGCNLARLKGEYPEAAAACISRGEDFPVVRFSRKAG